MAIPASMIVDVNPRLITAGGKDLEINGLFLTKNASIPTSEIALEFTTPDAVGEYFGMDSREYTAAVKYFTGYNNSFVKPRRVFFARRITTDVGAWLRGGKYRGTLEDLTVITDGSVTVRIDGAECALSHLDFSEAKSYSDVAEVIQAALTTAGEGKTPLAQGATVSYSSLFGAFTLTSGLSGAASTISFAEVTPGGTPLAERLCWTKNTGAVVSQGSGEMNIAENIAAVRDVTDNWVSFTTTYEAETGEALELAQWALAQGVNYLYQPWVENTASVEELDAVLTNANVGSTAGIVVGMDFAAFVCGIGACIDWNRQNGVITYAFKSQNGLTAYAQDETTANNLMNRGSNIYGNWATRNDNFVFLYPGKMYGDYGFIDPYINAVWLNNAIQVSIMNGLAQSPRTPYTEAGYALIRAWISDPVQRALRNGAIEPGITLSESQKAQLYREAGRDISQELNSDGYVLQIEDPGASVRVGRESPVCSLWYTYGGSVQRVSVASTAIL